MLSAAARSRGGAARTLLPGGALSARHYREGESVHGYRLPRKYELPAYAGAELANRVENGNLVRLATAYRTQGHLEAELDPLGLQAKRAAPELDRSLYGLAKGSGKVSTAGAGRESSSRAHHRC